MKSIPTAKAAWVTPDKGKGKSILVNTVTAEKVEMHRTFGAVIVINNRPEFKGRGFGYVEAVTKVHCRGRVRHIVWACYKTRPANLVPEVKVKRDREWEEYRVEVFFNGRRDDSLTYHAADKADAETTAAFMRLDLQPKTFVSVSLERDGGRYYATIANVPMPNGIKGCPLGRGASEAEAVDDLKNRVRMESGIEIKPLALLGFTNVR